MSLAKVIEVIAEGSTVEEAIENAVAQASETVHSIKSVWVENTQAIVEDDKVAYYRINARITFVLGDSSEL